MKQAFIPYSRPILTHEELVKTSEAHYQTMAKRRSIRMFSSQDVPRQTIENLLLSAGTAPSGAHKQPWTFVAVHNAETKAAIREAAEKEEYDNYNGRMSKKWLEDLEPFETDWQKPMLTEAPWLIVVFRRLFEYEEEQKNRNYYVNESVGIATGFLLSAIHQTGLCALTHTPSPMGFLRTLLKRPDNERAFMLIPVGYPASDCKVPHLTRKPLAETSVFID